jgi:hypothetical protein
MSFTSRLKKLFGFDIKVKTSGSLRDELDSGSVNSNVIAQATTYYDSMNVARQKRQERYDVYDSMDILQVS